MIAWSSPPTRSAAKSRGSTTRKQATLSDGLLHATAAGGGSIALFEFGP